METHKEYEIKRRGWLSRWNSLPELSIIDDKPCDFCGETTHTTENCPHAVDLKAAHIFQETR